MVLSLKTEKREPDITVIEISGRITIGRESSQVDAAVLKELNEGARKIVVDLAQVTSIDSTGIGIIAYCFGKASKTGARLHVSGAADRVLEVFEITHMNQVIPFFPSIDSACEAFTGAASAT
jgi:anti-sigma B factor antagonist